MNVLVTGALGFIGGSVAHAAFALGHDVVGLGRALGNTGELPFRLTSVNGRDALGDLIARMRPQLVVHAAGSASVGASISAPHRDFERSVLTWAELLEAVRLSGVRPLIIFPSSAAVYGNAASLPVTEDAPADPISPYGFHKLVCETLGREYASCFNLDVVAMRLFSIFGAAQRRLLVWELFEQLAGPAEIAFIQGTGHETRDFLHVDDMAVATLGIAERWARGHGFGAVNVASGEEISVIEVGHALRDLMAPGKGIECRGTERPGDPRRWRADTTRLRTLLPTFHPRAFRAALASCVSAWQAEGNATQQ